ncbi:MAG: NAD(P)-dependent glycerol-3-phosphate dehydrogenase [Verrucomicrobia bacterium]|jgi:glycerol-3-phosphate dehydrogenase (NAD(P)+)|nr:NAD(P)-dependent glycerol-3-phosphate dehydrogenase [Verrucomicrobiota bacterium]
MKITFLGAGAWGTALAAALRSAGHAVMLWDHDRENLAVVAATGRNEKYLPGIALPPGIAVEADAAAAARDAELVILAVPSKAFRTVAAVLRDFRGPAVTVTKGIEFASGLTMSRVLREVAPRAIPVALSGPTLALEVARGIPTAAVAASHDAAAARLVQELFHRPSFRVYTSPDVTGVELGGALKNVIAIGAGVCDGLGFGDNSKAALVTRAIVEMRRLGMACGANPETFSGLSGLGDLVVTCFSRLSRNRTLGERLGRGEKLADLLANSITVAEGYPTAQAAWQLARRHDVSTPVIDEVYAMLYEGKEVAQAVRDLTSRDSKAES